MSDLLNDMLADALEAHKVPCRRELNGVVVRDAPLAFTSRVEVNAVRPDSLTVIVLFGAIAPALDGKILWTTFAGLGADERSAALDGFTKFLLGPFHVLLSAFGNHACAQGSEEWREYLGNDGKSWRVCDSPLVTQGFDDPASVPFANVQQSLVNMFLREASSQVHWVDVFFSFLNGEWAAFDVQRDGVPWPEGIEIIQRWDFRPEPGYRSGRYFFVALKSDG